MWTRDVAYRGEVLLCSSKKSQTLGEVYSLMEPGQYQKFITIKTQFETKCKSIFRPTGIAGCVVNFVDYREMNAIEDPDKAMVKYEPGRKVLCFENIRSVESFKVNAGMLGLLNCPKEYEDQIKYG